MMHVADFNKAAPVLREVGCLLAIPARSLSEAFKGQDVHYCMCSMTGHVCRPAAHCANLILEALHKGLAGRNAALQGE